jgi:2-polyprenyl-3-methyl-5-hydroxy-6-metoxy-1,4-benzoquinol methylase
MYARRFRKRGLERMQKIFLDGLRGNGIEGKEVLDIGCGVGALHLTLLKDGAAKATGVDISEGMIDNAKKLAHELGVTSRANYVVGDFVQVSGVVSQADVTMLDKSVCCYENIGALICTSTAKTRNLYALSHPKENLFMKFAFKGHILLAKLFRWKFRPFWHDWKKLREDIQHLGFELIYSNATPMWQVLVFKRAN